MSTQLIILLFLLNILIGLILNQLILNAKNNYGLSTDKLAFVYFLEE